MYNSCPGIVNQRFDKGIGALGLVIPAEAGIQAPDYFLDSGSARYAGLAGTTSRNIQQIPGTEHWTPIFYS